jgi:hypothetical protein
MGSFADPFDYTTPASLPPGAYPLTDPAAESLICPSFRCGTVRGS